MNVFVFYLVIKPFNFTNARYRNENPATKILFIFSNHLKKVKNTFGCIDMTQKKKVDMAIFRKNPYLSRRFFDDIFYKGYISDL